MEQNRFGKALKDVLLAMINATLLLIALCLWLGWQVTSTFHSITSDFARSLVSAEPLRDDIRVLSEEVSALRADLGEIGEKTGEMQSLAAEAVVMRIDAVESRISTMASELDDLVQHPEAMINYAIDRAVVATKEGVADLRGCTFPDAVEGST